MIPAVSLLVAADRRLFCHRRLGARLPFVVSLSQTVVLSTLAEFGVKRDVNRMLIHLVLPQLPPLPLPMCEHNPETYVHKMQ